MNSTTPFFTKSNNEPLNLQRFIIPAEEITTGGAPALSYLFGMSHSQQNDFEQMTFADICNTAREPFDLDKELAPIFLPSTATAKTKEAVLAADSMTALVVDLDNGNLDLSAIERVLQAALVESYCVYSTKSATAENRRWRVVVPILDAIPCRQWQDMQAALSGLFGSAADDCTHRVTQVSYLPNRGEYYEYSERDGFPLDCNDTCHQLVIKSLEIMQQREHTEQLREQAAKPAQRNLSPAYGSTIAAYNETYSIPDLLTQYGYKKRAGGKWLHPESTSGIAGVKLLDGRYFSHHSTDRLADGHTHDAFDLFVCHEHGGDVDAALKAAGGVLVNSDGVTINKHNQREYMQQREQESLTSCITKVDRIAKPNSTLPIDISSVNIEKPPALAGKICRLMQKRADRDLPLSYPAAALHLLCAAGKGVKTFTGHKMSLITLSIAQSAAGKNNAQNVFNEIAHEAGLSRHVFGDVRSDKDMTENLIFGDGFNIYDIDEIHSMFKKASSKNAASFESGIMSEILKLATTTNYQFSGRMKRELLGDNSVIMRDLRRERGIMDDENSTDQQIKQAEQRLEKLEKCLKYIETGWPNPLLQIMGHSTPTNFDEIATWKNIESGLIGRCLIMRCGEERAKLRAWNEMSEYDPSDIVNFANGLSEIKRTAPAAVNIADDAKITVTAIQNYLEDDARRNHAALGAVYARSFERVVLVSSILAIGDGFTVTNEHLAYAFALVMRHVNDVEFLFSKQKGASAESSAEDVINACSAMVVRFAGDGEGITKSQLIQKIENCNQRIKSLNDTAKKAGRETPLEEIINSMMQQGFIYMHEDGKKRRIRVNQNKKIDLLNDAA